MLEDPLVEKIKMLSDQFLDELLVFKQSNPEFTFWLRQRDYTNSPVKRLENGYWFQGGDYIFISPYAKGDNNNKTRSIGFVTTFDDSLQPKNYIEVVWGAANNNSERLKAFYRQVTSFLGMEPLTETKYVRYYSGDNPLQNLRNFLEKDLQRINKLIREYGLENQFFIGEIDFLKQLRKTAEIRKTLYKRETNLVFRSKIDLANSVSDLSHKINPALGVKVFAKEIGNTIDAVKDTRNGNMFALFGRWGRGKTYMVDSIFEYLEKLRPEKYIRVDFNAWKYQDTHAAWAYLYGAFSKGYFRDTSGPSKYIFSKTRKKINLNFERKGFAPLIGFLIFLLSAGITAFFAWKYHIPVMKNGSEPDPWNIAFFLASICAAGLSFPPFMTFLFDIFRKSKKQFVNAITEYTKHTDFNNHLGLQAEIQRELKYLLKAWISDNDHRKIILFVDDIDRCNEQKIIQIVDALRVMLDDPDIYKRVIVLLAVDERLLKLAIRWKYSEILKSNETSNIVRMDEIEIEYLDKLFISSVKLNKLDDQDVRDYFAALTMGNIRYGESTKPKTDLDPDEDESGEDKNLSEADEEIYIDLEKEKYTLTEKEYEIFDAVLAEVSPLLIPEKKEFTPRKLNIIYHRYLLCKNLLTAQSYSDLNESETRLLIHYITRKSMGMKDPDTKGMHERHLEVADMLVPY